MAYLVDNLFEAECSFQLYLNSLHLCGLNAHIFELLTFFDPYKRLQNFLTYLNFKTEPFMPSPQIQEIIEDCRKSTRSEIQLAEMKTYPQQIGNTCSIISYRNWRFEFFLSAIFLNANKF